MSSNDAEHVLNLQAYSLFMQAPVGFSLVKGNDHTLELANTAGLTLAGKSADIIGKTISEILPGIERQGYIKLLDRVKHGGETINLIESPVTLVKNGKEETLYVNLIYQPYYEGNTITGVLSISTDVTQQVLAIKESEELRERFETMANNIPNLAWIADADGWIFWYNNRWYEYTGTTPEQMKGWGWKMVHDPATLPGVLEKWQLSIDTGEVFDMTFPIKGADGVYRPFLTRVVPVRNQGGEIIRWLGTNTDITKQKEMERLKDNFLSMASHELKTPVTTLKAYGQLAESLLEKKGDTQVLGMLQKMGKQVNRLTTLIEDLLDVTKIQSGKFFFTETEFDFHELVMEAINDMQATNASHVITCEECQSINIIGDRDKVGQVLNNLMSNAIKYSPKADKVVIDTHIEGEGVQLSIQDFGIGISLEDQKNVFDQFYRVTEENLSTFPGMGIGLYICSEIMKKQGGKIWIESQIGKGSTFFIWLPFDHRTIRNPEA